MIKPIIYFNSLDSLSGNGSIAGTSGHIPAYNGNKDIIAMINNDAYFYNNSVSSWEKINEEYVAGNHISISQNKVIEVSGWENKLDTSAYIETSANIINIIKNKVDISAFEISTSAINETIENKISLEEFENLSSSFITLNSPLTEGISSVINTVTTNSANWNNDLDTLYSAGPNINITNNTISSKDWTPELNTKLDSSAFSNVSGKDWTTELNTKLDSSAFSDVSGTFVQTLPESANWTKAYETVTANSANWDEVNEYSAGPNIYINNDIISSRDWTPELNTKLDSSAFSNVSGTFVQTLPTSSNWTKAYETVTANSAIWDEVNEYSAGSNINITNNTISSKDWTPELNAKLNSTAFSSVSGKFIQTLPASSNWNNTYSAVNSESANWTKAYDTVTANSASWNNDLDTLYSAGPNINITNNTISSKDWTPELNAKLNSTAFSNVSGTFVQTLPTSANWTKAYETVTANSANWINDLDTLYSAGSNINITDNTISSRDWTPELNAKLNNTAFTLPTSSNWTKAYETVTANSANWNNDLDTLYSAGSNINITNNTISSKDWTPELNAKLNSTAFSNVSGKFVQTLPTSANWNNTYSAVNSESANWSKAYDTVTANSANWNEVNEYLAGPNINITNNTISSKDWTPELNAKLNSTAFTLPTSSDWTKAYETVTANSANWENDIDVSNFITSSTELSGSYILSSNGQNAIWSQLEEEYDLSGFNGIIISANSANKTINVGYNGSGPISEVVYTLSAGQNIGIQSATDGINDYLVISANANSNVSLPESANWNNTYNTVTTNSANWNSVSSVTSNVMNLSAGQNIGIQSATDGINDYLVISANANSNVSLPESANWNNTYNTVTANSANWNNDLDTLYSAGSNINITNNTISSKDWTSELNTKLNSSAFSNVSGKFVQTLPTSSNWTKAYDMVTANSANWNNDLDTLYSAGSNINITNNTISSKDWTPELNAKLNSSAFSNVSGKFVQTLPTSANWTKAYETVTANSANWDEVNEYSAGPNINITNNTISSKDWTPELNTKLNSTAFTLPTSSNWNNVYSTVSANSASWNNDLDTLYSAGPNINITNNTISSKDWTPELNAKLNSTAFTLPTSANWTKAYETVTANSANWDEVNEYSAGPNINITNSTISSRDWTPELNTKLNSSAFSNVSGKFVQTLPSSANWNNTYNTVTANSASWAEVIDVSNFITSSTELSGSYVLSSNGSTTTWHELEEEYELSGLNGIFISANSANKSIDISLTECYDITGFNGILVSANSANKTIDITYSGNLDDLNNNTFILQAGQNIVLTSGENGDNKYLTISAAGIESIGTPYELSGGENINITSASIGTNNYLVISAKGGDSLGTPYNLSAGQNIGIQSATDGINDYLVISANAITEIDLPESANWNITYNTVTTNSANWNSVSSVTSHTMNLSAGQNIGIQSATDGINDYLVISANSNSNVSLPESANWNNVYNTVTANSASWNEDIQYSAGSNVNITNNTISSRDWTPELNAKLNSTAFTLPTSSNWNNTYSIVTSNSANWNSVSSITSNILNLSAGQNIGIQSATDGINDYLVISANSNSNVSLPESANWTKAYDTVTANSANWNNDLDTLYSAGPNINITNNTISSKDWTPELNAKLNSTAFALPSSANWNNTYDTVTTNSANWNSVSSVTSNVMNLSAGQNIGIQSATDGINDYLVISAIGGGEGATYIAGTNINITNNTISSRDWTPELNTKLNSTAFTLQTSANWTKAYETVTANSANWNEDIQYSAGSNINITNNTISSRDWTPELNAKLNSTAFSNVSGKFVQTLPSSANWNNTYNTVTANSAIWDEVNEYSAGSNINISNNTISSRDWTPELNAKLNSTAFKLPTSANWNNTYSTVTTNSANWSSMYSLVAGNSGYWGQGEGTVFELYSSNGTIGISSTTATGNKIIYDISLEGTTTSRNYFINRQEQTDAVEYLPNTNITLPDLGNGWQIVNGEANYGDIKYTSLSAYSMNGSAYIIPEEVKLASVDIRLDVIIPSGGLSANYQKVEIVIFDDIKNEYIGKYEKWIDISYDRTEQLNFSEIITEPSSVKLYFRSEFACQTYCRTFSLVDLTYKMLLINNNVTGGSVSLPSSANWNNTYNTVTTNSASWNSVSSVTSHTINLSAGQNIGIQSATDGINDYLVISANSNSNVSLPSSANWNNTYSTVTTNSANWNSVSSLSAKGSSILCQNISYTATGSNINVTIPNNTYATVSGLNVTGTINVIIPATNVVNGSELNSCAGRLMFSTNKPSTLNFVDSSITSKLPAIGQLPTTYSGTNYQFTCVAGIVACQEIKTIT
jgi:hypothetical protein